MKKKIGIFVIYLYCLIPANAQALFKPHVILDTLKTKHVEGFMELYYGGGSLLCLPYYNLNKDKHRLYNDSNILLVDNSNVFLFRQLNEKWGGYLVKDNRIKSILFFTQQDIYIMKSIDSTFNPSSLRLVLWKQKNCGFDVLHFHNCGFKDPTYDATNGILHYKKYRFYLFKVNKKINFSKLNVTRKRNYKGYGYQEYKWHHENK